MLALLPVTAAVSSDTVPPAPVPVAIAQPLTMPILSEHASPILPESGLLILIGSGLMGLAAIVRRTTKV
jgi:hypothetical protein